MSNDDQKISNLLKLIGNPGECKGCKQIIWWATSKNLRKMPLNPDGAPHWNTCRAADAWRKRKTN